MRRRYAQTGEEREAKLRQALRRARVDSIPVQTDKPYLKSLIKFYDTRYHRLHP